MENKIHFGSDNELFEQLLKDVNSEEEYDEAMSDYDYIIESLRCNGTVDNLRSRAVERDRPASHSKGSTVICPIASHIHVATGRGQAAADRHIVERVRAAAQNGCRTVEINRTSARCKCSAI